ncbi:DUF1176 domain-containing protein [Burkholderia cepacia]|uniref:DUF1176 domain-containing protein n=2 Tax=Burkholderiaceae TaxID=119060 RepID=A0A2S5E2Z0_9BURK|nr:DUF1176 domain-containing protein [Burkholderia cepacia]OXI57417.1 hypothetical protein CFB47_28985 [Burkholderia sp. AU27893]POZ85666.1 DUF1176 domain-containing protein [Burkholderia contaminans]EKS9801606.1 DUF1176 domain-containing protein [Burkholderia cepacia]EKS9811386.1 DUF1176 domain-containing protein [Burkholderia cepacia]
MPFAKARRRSLRPAPLADDALAVRRLPPAHPQSIRTVMSHRLSLAIAALLAVSPIVAQARPLARPPVERDFKNWSVVCDNGNRCIAESHADDIDDARTRLILRVTRDAGPDAQASLDLYATVPLDLRTARVDGRPFDAAPAQWQASGDKNDDAPSYWTRARMRTSDPATVAAWLAATRNGQLLSFGDPASAHTARTPLSGLSAALLLIDDTQGRVGTVTALLRPGTRPASSVPAAPALPPAVVPAPLPAAAVSAAERGPLVDAVLAKFGGDVKQCAADVEDEMSASDRRKASFAYAISADEALVSIPCQTSSLYNHTDLWYRVRRTAPFTPTAMNFGENANAGLDSASFANELTDAGYATIGAMLSSKVKLRSAGDCGSTATWIFDGRHFMLSDIATHGTCNGLFDDQWPRLYRRADAAASPR